MKANVAQWFEQNFWRLTSQGLWLRGGELNTLPATEWDRRPFRVLWSRLSTYWDCSESYTHPYLYQLAAELEGVYPDMAYLPPSRDVEIFERSQIPWWVGTQSKRVACDFDWIGISNSIVQELLNLPTLLEKSGIPLDPQERLRRNDVPLIILGGANALYSSVAWSWVDGVFVGESARDIQQLLKVGREGKQAGLSKDEILNRLSEVAGFLRVNPLRREVGKGSAKIQKSRALNLNEELPYVKGPVSFIEDSLGSASVQISEGCPCFCTFCAESWDRKPYRERSVEKALGAAMEAKKYMGLESIDLYSFNVNMHSGIYPLIEGLAPRFRTLGLKSQRFDILAHDPAMAELQHAVGKSSFTCGMEGISPRLRRYLRKNLSNEDLHKGLQALLKVKAREIKIFLIATGLEEEQDFVALDDFLNHLKEFQKKGHSQTRIILSVTPLVRFPWTPLEFAAAPSEASLKQIVAQISGRAKRAGYEYRDAADLSEYWVSQVLVRAGVEAGPAIYQAVKKLGYLHYTEVSPIIRQKLEEELRKVGVDPASLLAGMTLPQSEGKAWTQFETGVSREYLWKSYQEATQFEEEDYCLGRTWAKAQCDHCGGCPTRFHVRDIVLAKQKRGHALLDVKEALRKKAASQRAEAIEFQVSSWASGLPGRAIGIALARAILMAEKPGGSSSATSWLEGYRGYGGRGWAGGADHLGDARLWYSGPEKFTLLWSEACLFTLRASLADSEFRKTVNSYLGEWGEVLPPGTLQGDRPEVLVARAPFELKLDRYLKFRDLKHTLRKEVSDDGQVTYMTEFTKDALKKGYLKSCRYRTTRVDGVPQSEVHLTLGPKFDAKELQKFATEVFVLEREEQVACIHFEGSVR